MAGVPFFVTLDQRTVQVIHAQAITDALPDILLRQGSHLRIVSRLSQIVGYLSLRCLQDIFGCDNHRLTNRRRCLGLNFRCRRGLPNVCAGRGYPHNKKQGQQRDACHPCSYCMIRRCVQCLNPCWYLKKRQQFTALSTEIEPSLTMIPDHYDSFQLFQNGWILATA